MLSHRGSSLIEVLISILVLSIGLLGLTATQVLSLANSNESNHRYMAALAAEVIVERIRANPNGLEHGIYEQKVDGTESPVDCSSPCSVSALASLDLFEWGRTISSNLPDGTGEIKRNGNELTVIVEWKEKAPLGTEEDGTPGSDTTSFKMMLEI